MSLNIGLGFLPVRLPKKSYTYHCCKLRYLVNAASQYRLMHYIKAISRKLDLEPGQCCIAVPSLLHLARLQSCAVRHPLSRVEPVKLYTTCYPYTNTRLYTDDFLCGQKCL